MDINTQDSSFIDDLMAEQERVFIDEENLKKQQQTMKGELTKIEKYLLTNAHRRRIWLNIKDAKGITN